MAQKDVYNLIVNGLKITESDINEIYESQDWKGLMMRGTIWTAHIDGADIKEATMKYYYHRKTRYYFRNSVSKICIHIDGKFPAELKYGDEVSMLMKFA